MGQCQQAQSAIAARPLSWLHHDLAAARSRQRTILAATPHAMPQQTLLQLAHRFPTDSADAQSVQQ